MLYRNLWAPALYHLLTIYSISQATTAICVKSVSFQCFVFLVVTAAHIDPYL